MGWQCIICDVPGVIEGADIMDGGEFGQGKRVCGINFGGSGFGLEPVFSPFCIITADNSKTGTARNSHELFRMNTRSLRAPFAT